MNARAHKTILVLLILGGLLLATAGAVYAQSGGFDLSWWTVDGGGGRARAEDIS